MHIEIQLMGLPNLKFCYSLRLIDFFWTMEVEKL
jgi:hypothetical protein